MSLGHFASNIYRYPPKTNFTHPNDGWTGLDQVMLAVRPGSGAGGEGSVEETKDAIYGGPNPHTRRPSGGSRRVHGTGGG